MYVWRGQRNLATHLVFDPVPTYLKYDLVSFHADVFAAPVPHSTFNLAFVPNVSALTLRVICYLPLATWNPLSNLALIVAARPVSLPPLVHRTLALTRRVDPSLVPLDTLVCLKDLEIGGKVSEAPQV